MCQTIKYQEEFLKYLAAHSLNYFHVPHYKSKDWVLSVAATREEAETNASRGEVTFRNAKEALEYYNVLPNPSKRQSTSPFNYSDEVMSSGRGRRKSLKKISERKKLKKAFGNVEEIDLDLSPEAEEIALHRNNRNRPLLKPTQKSIFNDKYPAWVKYSIIKSDSIRNEIDKWQPDILDFADYLHKATFKYFTKYDGKPQIIEVIGKSNGRSRRLQTIFGEVLSGLAVESTIGEQVSEYILDRNQLETVLDDFAFKVVFGDWRGKVHRKKDWIEKAKIAGCVRENLHKCDYEFFVQSLIQEFLNTPQMWKESISVLQELKLICIYRIPDRVTILIHRNGLIQLCIGKAREYVLHNGECLAESGVH